MAQLPFWFLFRQNCPLVRHQNQGSLFQALWNLRARRCPYTQDGKSTKMNFELSCAVAKTQTHRRKGDRVLI
ncbi:hypothetical protein VNO77_05304 [Canavalia gladiata]|uniref:Uncharacterized protein n=1 Tax=Canavalia gladiata TaxID=3824 RepID=A0AAN9N4N3_CANGL